MKNKKNAFFFFLPNNNIIWLHININILTKHKEKKKMMNDYVD